MAITIRFTTTNAGLVLVLCGLATTACQTPVIVINESKAPVQVEVRSKEREFELKRELGPGDRVKGAFRPDGDGAFVLSARFADGRTIGPLKFGYYSRGEWSLRTEHVLTFKDDRVIDYNGRSARRPDSRPQRP